MARRIDVDKYVADWKRATDWEKPLLERGMPLHPAAEAQESDGNPHMYMRFIATLVPWVYTDWIDESMSWKETCYIGEWSSLVKFQVKGPDALRLISWLSVNNTQNWDIGQAKHCIMCAENGKVAGEGIVMRYGEDDFIMTGGLSFWAGYMLDQGKYNATGRHIGPERFLFQVQGPTSPLVMQKATSDNITDIDFMRFRETCIDDMAFTIVRTGMSGEIGYELHGPAEYAGEIYQRIYEDGKEFGIRKLGGRAHMVNHVEACFPTAGIEYMPAVYETDRTKIADFNSVSTEARSGFVNKVVPGSLECSFSDMWRSPVELGWKKMIKLDHDFHGRAAVEYDYNNQKRDMRTLVWNEEDVMAVMGSLFRKGKLFEPFELPRMNYRQPLNADTVLNSAGKVVGASSYPCYSVYFREMISLCTLDLDYCEIGTEVTVVWGQPGKRWEQKKIRAKVAPAPYKKDRRRADVSKIVMKR